MSDDLGFESRLLVDAARTGLGPDEIAVRRMRARIAATIAGGVAGIAAVHAAGAATSSAAATSATATSATATSAAATSAAATSAVATSAAATSAAATSAAATTTLAATGIGAKLAIAVVGIAMAAGVGVGVHTVMARKTAVAPSAHGEIAPRVATARPAPASHDAPSPVAPTVPAEPPAVPAESPIVPAESPTVPAEAPAVLAEPPADGVRSAPTRAAAPHAIPTHVAMPAPQAPPPSPPSLARETQLLGEAQSALSTGHLADAIAAVARYDAETGGRGQLAEDAAAIDVEARCKLRDPSAGESLDMFAARWPRSHEHARLVAECMR